MLCLLPMQQRVRRAFNKASNTYDDYSRLQRRVCQGLLAELGVYERCPNRIADLGCGTGVSTRYLRDRFSESHIYALDLADQLILHAKKKIPDERTQLLLADFDRINFAPASFDLVYANMSLQWSMNLKNTFSIVYHQLKEQGLFAFTLPLAGTFAEIRPAYRNIFYSRSQINQLLGHSHLNIRMDKEKRFVEMFDSSLQLMQSIKRTGASVLFGERQIGSLLCGFKSNAVFYKSNNQQLTYRIGYFIAEKNVLSE